MRSPPRAAATSCVRCSVTAADTLSDAEVNDSFYFTLFPNFHPWGAFNRIVYRFRPHGMSVDEAIMECMFLSPFPPGERPPPAPIHWLDADSDWTKAPAARIAGPGLQPGLVQPPQRAARAQGHAAGARHVRPLRGVEDPPLAHAPRRAPRPAVRVDYARCYHQGVRVPDLDEAMDELGAALSLDWCQPQERDQAVWLPVDGADHGAAPLHLLGQRAATRRAAAGSARARSGTDREQPGLHHVGLWSDDVAGETRASSTPAGRCASPSASRPTVRRVHLRPTAERAARRAGVDAASSRCSSAGSPADRWPELCAARRNELMRFTERHAAVDHALGDRSASAAVSVMNRRRPSPRNTASWVSHELAALSINDTRPIAATSGSTLDRDAAV